MKKIRFTMITVIAAITMSMGSVKAQEQVVTFGVKVGTNLSSFWGDMDHTKMVFKYQAGVTADIAVIDHLYLITGLDFLTKGSKYKPKGAHNVKFNQMYLQIPIHAGYKFDISPGVKIVTEAGPYFAYGIGGKAKGERKVNVFGDDRFKRFDFGLGCGVGMEVGKLAVKVGYDLGLVNISDMDGIKVRNHNAFLTVGLKL